MICLIWEHFCKMHSGRSQLYVFQTARFDQATITGLFMSKFMEFVRNDIYVESVLDKVEYKNI